jgi:O-methyltransferase involved in polyketide biosynthesis
VLADPNRYLDGQLVDGCRHVVISGAGLDARAFRLGIPADATIYEVDTAPVLDFREMSWPGTSSHAAERACPCAPT